MRAWNAASGIRRRALVVVLGCALIAAAGVSVAWWAPGGGGDDQTPTADDRAFQQNDASEIADAFNERSASKLAEILDPRAAEFIDEIAAGALPSGSTLAVDARTFEASGKGIGVVEAEVQGAESAEFDVLVRFDEDRWVVVSTGEARPR